VIIDDDIKVWRGRNSEDRFGFIVLPGHDDDIVVWSSVADDIILYLVQAAGFFSEGVGSRSIVGCSGNIFRRPCGDFSSLDRLRWGRLVFDRVLCRFSFGFRRWESFFLHDIETVGFCSGRSRIRDRRLIVHREG